MSRGLGHLLSALGAGLGDTADAFARQRALQEQQDQQLALRGYLRRDPKPVLSADAPDASLVPVAPAPADPLLGAARAMPSGVGGVLPGMAGRTGVGVPVPQGAGAGRPVTPELLGALKAAVTSPKPYAGTEVVQIGDTPYQHVGTPEEQHQRIQDAIKEQRNRQAFNTVLSRHPDFRGLPYEALPDWGSVLSQDLTRETRTEIDPDANQQYYADLPQAVRARIGAYSTQRNYQPLWAAYSRGVGQQDIRIEMPTPSKGRGGAEKAADGLTPTQRHTRNVQAARGKAVEMAAQGAPANSIHQYLNLTYPDVDTNQLSGIAQTAVKEYAPHAPTHRRGGSGRDFGMH